MRATRGRGGPSAAESVASLTITTAGAGRELAEWPYARRATYYRVFLKRVGTDTVPQFAGRSEDLDFLFKDLTPASTIEVHIIAAVTGGGEAPPSPTVSKVVGA